MSSRVLLVGEPGSLISWIHHGPRLVNQGIIDIDLNLNLNLNLNLPLGSSG